jgi:diphthine synthase
MLYLVGLGINSEKDLSLKGLETLKKCDKVYAEFYTNYTNADMGKLGSQIGKEITVLSRQGVEEKAEENLLKESWESDVALIVSGDPMVATTHIDLILRARKKDIKCTVIHSSSVYSAIAECGLQIYKFGRTASIAYPEGNYFPTSPYDLLKDNLSLGMHTLFLLDVKAAENRFMTINEGIKLLMEMEEKKKENIFSLDSLCIGVARLGSEDVVIRAGKASELLKEDFGKPPHCLIVPGKLHFMEEEALNAFSRSRT